jgi:hypothetical protein
MGADPSDTFRSDPSSACQLLDTLKSFGESVEVIAVSVTSPFPDPDRDPAQVEQMHNLAQSIDHLKQIDQLMRSVSIHGRWIGYDVALPIPTFHSIVAQPGIERDRDQLESLLNTWGLFNERRDAAYFASLANAMNYGPFPFCVVSVSQVLCEPV